MSVVELAPPSANGAAFNVTFMDTSAGVGAGGDVPSLFIETSFLDEATSGVAVTASVEETIRGSLDLTGDFTLTFGDGYVTGDIPVSASPAEVARMIETTIPSANGRVRVSRTDAMLASPSATDLDDPLAGTPDYSGVSFAITFVASVGDLPSMLVSTGRLNGTEAFGMVSETVAGTPAVLAYDGTGDDSRTTAVASGLATGAAYAFRVVALSAAVGGGAVSAPSVATPAIVIRAGASAARTEAVGGALARGFTGEVREVQSIVVAATGGDAPAGTFTLRIGNGAESDAIAWNASTAEVRDALVGLQYMPFSSEATGNSSRYQAIIGDVRVHVGEDLGALSAGRTGSAFRVTFLDAGAGDIPLLQSGGNTALVGANATVEVTEEVRGRANEFTIQPRRADGSVVRDVNAADGFAGMDLFFTEVWSASRQALPADGTDPAFTPASDDLAGSRYPASSASMVYSWSSDGGIATYEPTEAEVQRISIDVPPLSASAPAVSAGNFTLAFNLNQTLLLGGGNTSLVTMPLEFDATAAEVEAALEALTTADGTTATGDVEVTRYEGSPAGQGASVWDVTFLTLTGDVAPLSIAAEVLTPATALASMSVREVRSGRAAVQSIKSAAPTGIVREVQTVTLTSFTAATDVTTSELVLKVGESTTTIAVTSATTADELEAALGTILLREVTGAANTSSTGADSAVPTPFDFGVTDAALQEDSTAFVKASVSVDTTGVAAAAGVTGATRWSITFAQPLGNVPEIEITASSTTPEDSAVATVTNGSSPLTGTFTLSFESDETELLGYDATASDVKAALEALPNVGTVDVDRSARWNGLTWLVTFRRNAGSVPLIQPGTTVREVQRITTSGGSPTPLSGSFTLQFGGVDSAAIPHDASASEMQAALELLPGLGSVRVSRQALNGPAQTFEWSVTFVDFPGDAPILVSNDASLRGSSASVAVEETRMGAADNFDGGDVLSKHLVVGKPAYAGRYAPSSPGPAALAVRQLVRGGLTGAYYDSQWFRAPASMERLDAGIDFDFGEGLVTPYARDYVSIRWTGKLKAPSTEQFTFYVSAVGGGVRVWINHELLLSQGMSPSDVAGQLDTMQELQAGVELEEGKWADVVVEYRHSTGSAAIKLEWSSPSRAREVIPAGMLAAAEHIQGSPFAIDVRPGMPDAPFSMVFGEGAESSSLVAGVPTEFYLQLRDAQGNNRTDDATTPEGAAVLNDISVEVAGASQVIAPVVESVGSGLFRARYTPTSAGTFSVSVSFAGEAVGASTPMGASPYSVTVLPGRISYVTTSVSGNGLTEGVAGDVSTMTLQARDSSGNQITVGGDASRIVARASLVTADGLGELSL